MYILNCSFRDTKLLGILFFLLLVYVLFYHSALLIHVFDPPFHISPYHLEVYYDLQETFLKYL